MLCKLILRNVHRSARDYGIYLVTLILSVGMFYGFLSLSSSHYQAALPRSLHLDLLERGMQVAIPVLGLLLLFLLSYVNAHLLRAKQKSFAVQTILGMERQTVALLFFGETLLLGSLAILAGIALGGLSLPAGQFRGFSGLWRILPAPARSFSRYPCPDSPVLWQDLFGGGPAQPGSGAAASRAVHAAG